MNKRNRGKVENKRGFTPAEKILKAKIILDNDEKNAYNINRYDDIKEALLMIFETWLLAKLAAESASKRKAQKYTVNRMTDKNVQREIFFKDLKKKKQDLFCFCSDMFSSAITQEQILEKLDLVDAGLFPFPYRVWKNTKTEQLKAAHVERYKPQETPYDTYRVCYYFKPEDIKDLYDRGYCWPKDDDARHNIGYELGFREKIREALFQGKVTIADEYGNNMQVATAQEAREYMDRVMEERFEKHWENHIKYCLENVLTPMERLRYEMEQKEKEKMEQKEKEKEKRKQSLNR